MNRSTAKTITNSGQSKNITQITHSPFSATKQVQIHLRTVESKLTDGEPTIEYINDSPSKSQSKIEMIKSLFYQQENKLKTNKKIPKKPLKKLTSTSVARSKSKYSHTPNKKEALNTLSEDILGQKYNTVSKVLKPKVDSKKQIDSIKKI